MVPGSSRNGIAGWLGETLKVRVTARPERGKANAAVEQVLAAALGLPGNCTRVIAGKSSARKVVEISGLSESEVYRRLSKELYRVALARIGARPTPAAGRQPT